MILKQRLFTNMFLRNMLADFGNRSANSTTEKFTPYFQYRIGNYRPDYYLYFPREPFPRQYKNEAFNKMLEYAGHDLTKYLDFHYTAYADKAEFLRFIQYEISDRLKPKYRQSFRQKLRCALEWIAEQRRSLKTWQETTALPSGELRQDAPDTGENEKARIGLKNIENEAEVLSKKLSEQMDQIMVNTRERMENLTAAFVTGNIELNNHNHLEKIIQLLILLQTAQAPREISKAEQLFKKFSATDIASILHLHFGAFKDKQINTLQVKIRQAGDRLNHNNPKVEKLTAALQEFFYS